MIEFECSGCFQYLKVKDELQGKRIRCKHCGETVRVEKPRNRKTMKTAIWTIPNRIDEGPESQRAEADAGGNRDRFGTNRPAGF